jgi:hypothetical protein
MILLIFLSFWAVSIGAFILYSWSNFQMVYKASLKEKKSKQIRANAKTFFYNGLKTFSEFKSPKLGK